MDEHDSPALRPRGPDATPAGPVIAGRYRVERLIARGGMAAVFLAEQIALRRRVALKILHPPPDPEETGNYAKRFQLEAETLATLDHPNIVTLYDYGGAEDGRFYLAMEHIDGPRYTDLLANGVLETDRAIRLLLQVCAALRYAHKRGVIHRDLKPSNLLIRTDAEGQEQVKVVDFGLVKVTEIDQSLTREGLVLGSPHCMAPEQVRGSHDIDHRADIYAIGILLFRSLTGTYPFHGATSTATMVAHLNEPIPTFASAAPDVRVPARLEEVTRRCLAKRPQDRYADVKALMEDLAACIGLPTEPDTQSLSVEETPNVAEATASTMNVAPAPAPRERWPLVAGLVLLLLLSVSGVAWLAGVGAPDVPPTLPDRDARAPAEAPTGASQAASPVPDAPPAPPAPDAAPDTPPDAVPDAAPAPAEPVAEPTVTPPVRKSRGGGTTRAPSTPNAENVPSEGQKAERPPEGYMPLPDDFQ